MQPVFNIGDQVQTIPGPGVRTSRQGIVITRFLHVKESVMMYKLQIDGKAYKKRYRENELQLLL